MNILQERVLKVLFVLIWVLALIHMTAEYYHLYYYVLWFDMVTHFLGGVWLGVGVLWAYYLSEYVQPRVPGRWSFFVALLAGLLFGVLWEAYEFGVWQWSGVELPANYVPDTQLDLVMDVVGAAFGYLVVLYIVWKTPVSQQ